MLLAGGNYALIGDKRATPQMAAARGPSAVEKAAQDAQLAAEAQRLKDQEELARLRAEAAAREKAEQEAAQRHQIEEETRRKVEAEMADKQRQQDEARQKARPGEADGRAAGPRRTRRRRPKRPRTALRLTMLDRQHVQVALAALGFGTAGTDGVFGRAHARDDRGLAEGTQHPPTGYLTGAQNQALLRDAAPAIARFDEEQKKLDEARKKADEEKAKAEAAARAAPPPQAAARRHRRRRRAQQRGRDHAEIRTRRHLARNAAVHAVAQWRRIPFPSADQRGGRQPAPGCAPAPDPAPAASSRSASGSADGTSWSRASSRRAISRASQQTATMRAQFDGASTISGGGAGAQWRRPHLPDRPDAPMTPRPP